MWVLRIDLKDENDFSSSGRLFWTLNSPDCKSQVTIQVCAATRPKNAQLFKKKTTFGFILMPTVDARYSLDKKKVLKQTFLNWDYWNKQKVFILLLSVR